MTRSLRPPAEPGFQSISDRYIYVNNIRHRPGCAMWQSRRPSGFLKRQGVFHVCVDCHGPDGPRNDGGLARYRGRLVHCRARSTTKVFATAGRGELRHCEERSDVAIQMTEDR
jgi:hypothetical protein